MCEYCRSWRCPPQCPSYKPEVIGKCENCQEPIAENEDYFEFPDGSMWCEDCVYDKFFHKAN